MKKEKEKKILEEAKETLIYGNTQKNKLSKEHIPWKQKSRSEKASVIISWIIFGLEVVYVALILLAPTILPGTLLAKVSSAYKPDMSDTSQVWASVLLSLYYLLLLTGISKLARFILTLVSRKLSNKGKTLIKITNSAIKYAVWIILIFIVLAIWGVDTTTILASAGIVALIIGLGAQTLIADVISGCTIVFENQFDVGDTVVIDDFRGVVTDIGLSITKITDAGGNTKAIRNSQIGSAINLSQDASIAVVDIPFDYAEDFRAVRKLFEDNIDYIASQTPDLIGKPELLGIQEFKDSSVILRIIAYTREETKFSVTRRLNEVIFLLMKDNGYEIPFNQIVVSSREKK